MFNVFKKRKKEVIYVQEPSHEKPRQLFYVDVSKDQVIQMAKEQQIEVSGTELDRIKDELFDRVMKDVESSIQANLFKHYSDVAQEVITAFGGPQFITKLKSYRKVLLGIEITLPENKSRAEKVLITRFDKEYAIIFSGQNVYLPVNKVTLEQIVRSFEAITGITAIKPEQAEITEYVTEAKPEPVKPKAA